MAVYKTDVLSKENMEELLIILVGVLTRLMPHPANITAVGGLALFSGAKFDVKKSIILTLTTMLISDAFIGFHSLLWATYGGMLCAVLIGKWIGSSPCISRLAGGVLSSAIIFFVITNFAVWAATPLYPRTINGLINCYIMALPFFRNSITGDFISAVMFFYAFEFIFAKVQRKTNLRFGSNICQK